ncbi:MAG: glycosyltransferase [Flavobacteriaceae bacterium]
MKKYSVIIPAHNEEKFLEGMLQTLCEQTIPAAEIVLVNDNSTDNTEKIMQRFATNHKNITYIHHNSSKEHLPGTKVIDAFLAGYKKLKKPYDVIVKMDADLLLPINYFEVLMNVFKNKKIGIAGGFCYEADAQGIWKLNHPMEQSHVRGAFKAYSKECYLKIGGLLPAMGWDTVDELLARYYGFEVKTLENIHVKHLRPLGAGYAQKADELQGAAFYVLRYGKTLTLLASLKNAFQKRSIHVFFRLMKGYQKAKRDQQPFLINENQGKFIRTYRWNKILKKSS